MPRASTLTSPGIIAFDGDDTLWHNESIFSVTQERYRGLLRDFVDDSTLDQRLLATERRNLRLFGYGIKAFMLSMIETAIEVSEGRVSAPVIQTMIDLGKEMLEHPIELLEGVQEVIEGLHGRYRLMVITKGDLFDQESKLARSGLADLFWKVEIVSEKDPSAYQRILAVHEIAPEDFLMVGNSIRSDIAPVVAAGGRAVHIPYALTWALEQAELDQTTERVWTLEHVAQLPALLRTLESATPA